MAENIFPLEIPIIHNQAIEDIKVFLQPSINYFTSYYP